MTPPTDDELRERFAALRAVDRERAPDFHTLWRMARERAPVGTPLRWPRRIGILAAAGLVLASGILFRSNHHSAAPEAIAHAAKPALDSTPNIGAWRSPTAEFLHALGDELLHATPLIESSILDGAAPPSTQRKGD